MSTPAPYILVVLVDATLCDLPLKAYLPIQNSPVKNHFIKKNRGNILNGNIGVTLSIAAELRFFILNIIAAPKTSKNGTRATKISIPQNHIRNEHPPGPKDPTSTIRVIHASRTPVRTGANLLHTTSFLLCMASLFGNNRLSIHAASGLYFFKLSKSLIMSSLALLQNFQIF